MKRKKYDTSVIMLYLLKLEHLLPKEFRQKIPYSTIASWRKNSSKKYEGSQFRFLFDDNWDIIRLKNENRKLRNTIRSISQSYLLFKTDLEEFIKTEKKNKEFQNKLVLAINNLRQHVGLELALKLFFTHRNQFYEWVVASRHNCSHSFNTLCLRRYPRQLQRKEVEKIKSMLTSPKYERWPIVSIAAQGLRNGEVIASLYSWYKYARVLNLPHNSFKKKTKQVGLVASKPNEYLHIDTTYYPILNRGKVCITIVMDNYSRMILGFSVEERLSFTLIKSAVKSALTPILIHQKQKHSFLVSDGGWENISKDIHQFISNLSEYRISKITALKDIQFSNSPVEAIHKIIKGRYLRNKEFETMQGLSNFLKDAIYDYNYVRPHYKHFPKTPTEVYFNTDLMINFRNRVQKAIKARVKNNVNSSCSVCKMTLLKEPPFPSTISTPNKATLGTYDIS